MKYLKPKISSKKIKLNFFLTNITPLDKFTIIGDVYAGSGDCGGGGLGGSDLPNCLSASNSGRPDISHMFGLPEGSVFGLDISCTSNSNSRSSQGGCLCNSQGGQCNSGSGGGSGNSGSGSCNSGG